MTEWNAVGYAEISGLQEAMAEEQLALLDLGGAERTLDVGCGDGKITAKIAARLLHGSALGCDPSHEMIAFASSHFGAPAHPNLRFEVADARSLPYRSEFDLAVSFNALHWVIEQEEALRSIHEALKLAGRAVLRFVSEGERQCLEDVIEETRQSARWSGYFQGFRRPYVHFTPGQYRALAERGGFEIMSLRVKDKAWDFKTREAFAAFCRVTMVEWTRLLPEGEMPAFIEEVLDRYRRVAAESDQEANTFKFYQMEIVLQPRSLTSESSPDNRPAPEKE